MVLLGSNSDHTKITRKGLLAIGRLLLTYLTVSKVIGYLGENSYGSYGDEEADVVQVTEQSRQIRNTRRNNKETGVNASPLGRLPLFNKLFAGTCESRQKAPE